MKRIKLFQFNLLLQYPTNEFKFDNFIVCNKSKRELFSSFCFGSVADWSDFFAKWKTLYHLLNWYTSNFMKNFCFFVELLLSSAATKQFPIARLISRIKTILFLVRSSAKWKEKKNCALRTTKYNDKVIKFILTPIKKLNKLKFVVKLIPPFSLTKWKLSGLSCLCNSGISQKVYLYLPWTFKKLLKLPFGNRLKINFETHNT